MDAPHSSTEPTQPIYYILEVCESEGTPNELAWFEEWLSELKSKGGSVESKEGSVKLIQRYSVGFDPKDLKNSEAVESICRKHGNLVGHIKKKTNCKDDDALPPVIFVGFGFAALVVMEAVCQEPKLKPMGVVLASVAEGSVTWNSENFQTWYQKLGQAEETSDKSKRLEDDLPEEEDFTGEERKEKEKEPEMKDFLALKKVLLKFNRYCRRERIRFSYVSRQEEVSWL